LNRASLALTDQLLWLALKKALKQARADLLNLAPRERFWRRHPMLYGISPSLLPRPQDWAGHAVLCGQWVPPPASDYVAPPRLTQFLAAGSAAVYVGCGSMTGIDLPRMLRMLIDALNGRRAVVWPGWSDMGSMPLTQNVLSIDAAPHDWLFPQMSAVVHHGGSGTLHSAAKEACC